MLQNNDFGFGFNFKPFKLIILRKISMAILSFYYTKWSQVNNRKCKRNNKVT